MIIAGYNQWRIEEPTQATWIQEEQWRMEEIWPGPSESVELGAGCQREVLSLDREQLLAHVCDAIAASQCILQLPDNFDDEGSMAYSEGTWQRAVEFVRSHTIWVWEHLELVVNAPNIAPGPDGSIDIHWEDNQRELLVNIPSDRGAPLRFYGDDKGEDRIKGTLSGIDSEHGLLAWLTKGK